MSDRLSARGLSVGYAGRSLVRDIDFSVGKGEILTLIGPNGAGKSTLLKTLTRHLSAVAGTVYLEGSALSSVPPNVLAKKTSVLFTDRVQPEMMRCYDVVAMGRYPYTGRFGTLGARDHVIVRDAIRRVQVEDIADLPFDRVSDGQRRRVMLARALAQEPEIIVLDEPTSYLDIRYKLELLNLLTRMAREQGITVILSLHEIELAARTSDRVLCVKDGRIAKAGTPEEIFTPGVIERLYDMEEGSYNVLYGSTELARPTGAPRLFVVGGAGLGIPFYRALQKRQTPFAVGVLFENDLDVPVAGALSGHVITTPAFCPMRPGATEEALALLERCVAVLDAGTPIGTWNADNAKLFERARAIGLPVLTSLT